MGGEVVISGWLSVWGMGWRWSWRWWCGGLMGYRWYPEGGMHCRRCSKPCHYIGRWLALSREKRVCVQLGECTKPLLARFLVWGKEKGNLSSLLRSIVMRTSTVYSVQVYILSTTFSSFSLLSIFDLELESALALAGIHIICHWDMSCRRCQDSLELHSQSQLTLYKCAKISSSPSSCLPRYIYGKT